MKRLFPLLIACLALSILPARQAKAQIPILDIIKAAVKKVIVAVDLQIQRLQTKTIYLQEAQKKVENGMSRTELGNITHWVQRQKDLYAGYYRELWRIKNAITYYQRVKDMIDKQAQLVNDYKRGYALFRQDNHFSGDELSRIYRVYNGILHESIENIGQLHLVIVSFTTQMSDADRLKIIDAAGERIDRNYSALQQFTQENILLSRQRAKDQNELDQIKLLYGIK